MQGCAVVPIWICQALGNRPTPPNLYYFSCFPPESATDDPLSPVAPAGLTADGGDQITVKRQPLPKGTFAKLQPVDTVRPSRVAAAAH